MHNWVRTLTIESLRPKKSKKALAREAQEERERRKTEAMASFLPHVENFSDDDGSVSGVEVVSGPIEPRNEGLDNLPQGDAHIGGLNINAGQQAHTLTSFAPYGAAVPQLHAPTYAPASMISQPYSSLYRHADAMADENATTSDVSDH